MKIITHPAVIEASGYPAKLIEEFVGNVNSKNSDISIAKMKSPQGWVEPGQTPEFDEFTVILKGTLVMETRSGKTEVHENQAAIAHKGEWVQYSSPYEGGAEYIAICLPAFSPVTVHRDDNP